MNATELSAYCRERGLFPEQVSCWRQAAQDANAKPVPTMAEQKELEKLRALLGVNYVGGRAYLIVAEHANPVTGHSHR